MIRCIRSVAAVLLAGASALLLAADPPPVPVELIKQLGSRDFRTREQASKKLWELGETARPALEAALKDPSAEIANRAQKVLDKFNRGILPDTSPELLALIDRFIADSEGTRFDTARQLIALGPKGVTALDRQLRKGFGSAQERYDFYQSLQLHLRKVVPILLYDGKEAEAEALLRLNIYGQIWLSRPGEDADYRSPGSASGPMDYATYLIQRGKGKELVERVIEATGLHGDRGGTGLLCAHRMTDNHEKLLPLLAELTKDNAELARLREGLLMDMGEWATLAEEVPGEVNSQDGLKAFRLRQAGKIQEADALLAEIKASDPVNIGGYKIEDGALALLLNGRTEEGVARLKESESAPHVLTDILAARLEFRDALDLIRTRLAGRNQNINDDDLAPRAGRTITNLYLAKKGRILAQLGERDAAAQVFNGLAEQIAFNDPTALLQLIKAEVRSGFAELAAELLGRAQAQADAQLATLANSTGQDPYEILFEADAEAAYFWWQVFRETRAQESGAKRMATVRRLIAGKLTPAEVQELLAEAGKAKFRTRDPLNPANENAVSPERKAVGLATAQRLAGDRPAAVATLLAYLESLKKRTAVADPNNLLPELEDAPDFGTPGNRQWVFGIDEHFRLWLDLGDLLLAQKKPTEAAAALLDGWRRAPDNGILLYYSGKALLAAGNEKEGQRRIALSHIVPLGNSRLRARFLEELVNRGEPADDLRAERETAKRTAWLIEGNNGNVWNQIARASAVLKDFPMAAAANRRAIHYVLRTEGVTYVEGYAYVNVLSQVRGYEARQLLAEGKIESAIAAAKDALALLPSNTDLVIGLVTGLDRANRKADAEALFKQAWISFGTVIQAHPDSAWARHTAAWMASACQRELKAALAYSAKAVELEPNNKAYRSGLAEAHFRNGDREKALNFMEKLSAEDFRNHFYRRQLERYKTAAFDAPLPDNDED